MEKFLKDHAWVIIYSICLILNLLYIVQDILVKDTMGVFINVAFSAVILYFWDKNDKNK